MAEVLNTKDMSHEEWLKARQSGIGGSDAGTILGVNKWKSKTQLFFEKVNPELKQQVDNEFIYWGNVLEDVVAKEFEARTGKKVRKNNKMLRHPEHEFMLANLDRVIVGEKALLECKTTSQYNIDQWKDDEIPASYLCQIQHYMAVTGYEKAYIAVLCGGNQFIWKEVPRDDELIEIIINAEKDFWYNNVLAGVIPEIDGSDATKDFLNHMYKDIDETEVQLGDDVETLLTALEQVKQEEKELKELKTQYENKIKHILGNNLAGKTSGYQVTWKPQVRKTLDTKKIREIYGEQLDPYYKETETRVLKIKQIKGA
ncbi:YqaJ viral recombinase family protein [Macrococcoides caseolyticum]|uniref:YqaJ viral recombinase family nuclease n=1 Tax=Macrococcoides caseolyticum TaxID=69966 RepID=UPI001C5F0C5D|nr:YqaJ viral recombinase family protein [Macrococcus caseolyticus]QYA39283.1 YqaJ viral recombinase family protein [Macrococcus caseolyticus]